MMKRSIYSAAFVALMTIPTVVHGQDSLADQFQHNKTALHELVAGLSSEQWNFKAAEDRWSIAEIVEHITVAEQYTLQVLTEQLTEREVNDEQREMAAGFEQQISATLADRSQTFQAPDDLRPTGRWTGDDVMSAFNGAREGMLEFLKNADFDLRTRIAMHPVLGTDVDASGWATISVQHCMRHMQQIQEVMESDGYPSRQTR